MADPGSAVDIVVAAACSATSSAGVVNRRPANSKTILELGTDEEAEETMASRTILAANSTTTTSVRMDDWMVCWNNYYCCHTHLRPKMGRAVVFGAEFVSDRKITYIII